MKKHYSIAFLLGYPEISGGTNVIMEHAVGLNKLGHKVYIVTELPFEKHRLSWHPEAMELECLSHEECRSIQFDISIATWWRSAYDLPFVKAKRYAYFCQSIESRFFSEKNPDMKALAEFSYRLPFPVVTEATWIADYLKNHYGSSVTLVRNGIRKDIFTMDGPTVDKSRPSGLRILVEGPLGVAFKRVEETITLCQQAGVKDIWLLTSTPTDSYPGISRLFSKVPMKEVPSIYRSCDVLVKLSTVEGMFGPPLEIMHCGGTAITSDVTGHDEYMKNYHNGIVVPMGNQQQVIKELRALIENPNLVNHLKENARETAEDWPSWTTAVQEMEQFIVKTIEENVDEAKMQEITMNTLISSLKLAGPLFAAVNRTYNKKELLFLMQEGCKRYVKRTFPGLYEKARLKKTKPQYTVATKLPDFSQIVSNSVTSENKVVFIGLKRKHYSSYPEGTKNFSSFFVPVENKSKDQVISEVLALGANNLVIFDSYFSVNELSFFKGSVFIILSEPVDQIDINKLTNASENIYILHSNSKAATALHSKGVKIYNSIALPINPTFINQDTLENWLNRKISLGIIGDGDKNNVSWIDDIQKLVNFIQLKDTNDEKLLCAFLSNVRTVLYLPSSREDFLRPTQVVRDLTAGCLVISPKFDSNYLLLPGEHYLSYDNITELERILNTLVKFPDAYEIVRRVGMEKALQFNEQAYLEIIAGSHSSMGDLK